VKDSRLSGTTSDHEMRLVAAFFGNMKGYFAEVGANDPREGSQTWHLEQAGWTGILIEPVNGRIAGRFCANIILPLPFRTISRAVFAKAIDNAFAGELQWIEPSRGFKDCRFLTRSQLAV
jgi:hypothetical protein